MRKLVISKLSIYKHRFVIGFACLGAIFTLLLFLLPIYSPAGLSEAEMLSAVESDNLHTSSVFSGDMVNMPYRLLQKISISFFGLSVYSVKLPSIIIGLATGIFLILLLNRWFKTNVALLASCIVTLSTPFLFVAGSGTPDILYLFWPTILLWLGSKIQGNNQPNPIYCFVLALTLSVAVFTPYFIYLAAIITLFALTHPHLRFTLKNLPKIPLILSILLLATLIVPFVTGCIASTDTFNTLLFTSPRSSPNLFTNLSGAFAPFFSFSGNNPDAIGVYLSPLLGLAFITLVIIGAISSWNKLFTSKNATTIALILFTVATAALYPDAAILILLPFAILAASGIRLILEKWYGIFPENPYARIFGLLPISIFSITIIFSGLSHYFYGYKYSHRVAGQFSNDLTIIKQQLPSTTILLVQQGTLEYDFYKILEKQTLFTVTSNVPDRLSSTLVTLGKWPKELDYTLESIITSSKAGDSDRIYTYKQEQSHGVRPSEDAQPAP